MTRFESTVEGARPGPCAAVAELRAVLDLVRVDEQRYRGRPAARNQRQRTFGGLVAAQALTAAIRSVQEDSGDFGVHSLHSWFLLPGDARSAIVYDVGRMRDGRSFRTRRVTARQDDRVIFELTASFHRREAGVEHHDPMPAVRPPDECVDALPLLVRDERYLPSLMGEWEAVELRLPVEEPTRAEDASRRAAQRRLWFRVAEPLPDDPSLHLAAVTFASDIGLLGASLTPHDVDHSRMLDASLDHTIWFHRPVRADGWLLYDQQSPAAQDGRGLSIGRIFDEPGRLVATVAQEGLIRGMRDPVIDPRLVGAGPRRRQR